MLAVRSVTKSFGSIPAVRGVSFDIAPGQVVGLLGPNGAGKTTTIRMITGMFPPDSGTISVDGADTIEDSIKARRAIGYLPESAPAYAEMSVESLVDYRATLFGMPRRERRERVERVIERCWLSDVRKRRVGHLSKGYRQRVGLAAAIVHEPKVLILDEPSNGLDPTQIAEMRRLIRELGRDRAVLVSSHILPEVEKTCDRAIIVIRGTVRADGTPESLTSDGHGFKLMASHPSAGPNDLRELLTPLCGATARVAVESSGDGIRATAAGPGIDSGTLDAIGKQLFARGWTVRELTPSRRTLEAVFLSLLEDTSAGRDA
ncbi:MAG: ABC transporter ATP-binding protein [Tepidisphaera sp.]